MPFQLPDGRLISPDVAFTLNGVQYPANFLRLSTEQEKAELGIIWVAPDPVYDQRFFWGYNAEGNLIPKDHTQLVEQWTQQTRTTANTLLAPTDWMIIRESDNGKAADPAIKTWREDIRLASGSKVTAIAATVDTAELAAYITGTEYPVWPADPYAPIPDADAGDVAADGMEPAVDGSTI
jgi:hypothetical protein